MYLGILSVAYPAIQDDVDEEELDDISQQLEVWFRFFVEMMRGQCLTESRSRFLTVTTTTTAANLP